MAQHGVPGLPADPPPVHDISRQIHPPVIMQITFTLEQGNEPVNGSHTCFTGIDIIGQIRCIIRAMKPVL